MSDKPFVVELTQGAEADLESIHSYATEYRSPAAADHLLDLFLEAVAQLERFPYRGHVPKELETLGIQDFRQVLLESYRVIYRVIGQRVFVSIIVDGRRDMQTLLEQRLLRR